MAEGTTRITIFPLTGAILYPGLHLPLHIFEPRYRAMISDALARDRRIGMIQPQREFEGAPLYQVGCLGRIGDVQALDDGGFNIVLEGEARFRVLRELDVTTPFRQIEPNCFPSRRRSSLRLSSVRASSGGRGVLPRRKAIAWTGMRYRALTTFR